MLSCEMQYTDNGASQWP